MQDYFKATEFILEKVQFYYLGKRYEGRGVMKWDSSQGFHIEAPLDFLRTPQIEPIEFGRFGVIRKQDAYSIRILLDEGGWAINPSVLLIDRYDVISQQRLSINLSKMFFVSRTPYSCSDSVLIGSALFETNRVNFLSDQLKREEIIKVDGKFISESKGSSFGGIFYEGDAGQKIYGYMIDKKHLKVSWSLPRTEFTARYSWRLAEAIQSALSILLGQRLNLLERRIHCGDRERIEIRKQEEVLDLHFLKPISSSSVINKEHFIKLTDFIVSNGYGSDVCLNIFRQLLRASQETDLQTQEFIVSSILEAALRNIENQPFLSKKRDSKKWNVSKGLQNFSKTFLSNEWELVHKRVMTNFGHLRDRSAHPDWLLGGALSEEEKAKSLDCMIFLSRFYGYMILALAGFQDLEPRFPSPHSEWGAPVKITSNSQEHLT